jgi:hypothetical protein
VDKVSWGLSSCLIMGLVVTNWGWPVPVTNLKVAAGYLPPGEGYLPALQSTSDGFSALFAFMERQFNSPGLW